MAVSTINLLGRDWPVKLPPQFAVKEDLVVAWGESEGDISQRQRVAAAIVGICTDLGREAKADYVKANFKVLAYGGAVYSHLRTKGASMGDVYGAALALVTELYTAVFPREQEVKERADFTAPAGDE